MAQTGFTPLKIYASSTAGVTPSASKLTNDTSGSELAINIADGKLFYKDSTGTVQVIATKATASITYPLAVVNGGTGVTTSTGTGSTVLSVSPDLTGTPTAPTASPGTNTTQLATTAFVLANGVPTGGLVMWSTGTAPSGFLLCTGTAVSRTIYAALFAIIGTTFGAGDGSTTFNLPNYTNRMPYGTTIGATGGSADAVVVSHTHTATVTDPGHLHALNATTAGGSTTEILLTTSGGAGTQNTNTATTGITVANTATGVSGTNANLPPYLGINFIIKT